MRSYTLRDRSSHFLLSIALVGIEPTLQASETCTLPVPYHLAKAQFSATFAAQSATLMYRLTQKQGSKWADLQPDKPS